MSGLLAVETTGRDTTASVGCGGSVCDGGGHHENPY